jgi:hypothetical protein
MRIALDKVCELIVRARMLDVKEGDTDAASGSNAVDDGMTDVLTDDGGDATEQEIRSFVHGLNDDERHDLVALVWVGRGDFDGAEWGDAVANAAERGAGDTADYLIGIPNLGDLLDEGLAALGRSCADAAAEGDGQRTAL